MNSSRKILFIGWDSADWRVINPLLCAGEMPHLKRLVEGGVSGNIATLYPSLSPMLWTSIATGKRPHKHGIHGFTEPNPQEIGVRPITNLSRGTKAFWNILSQNNKKCIVVGWWPSHPAEPLPGGVMVSNAFQRGPNSQTEQSWPMAAGTVHPVSLAKALGQKRRRSSEIKSSAISRFVPRVAGIDRSKDRRIDVLAKIIADYTNIHAAGMHLIKNEPWDVMATYYDAIDHFGHGFMRYHPPRQKWISKKDFELYRHVIEAGYRCHDKMLGELLKAAGSGTTVLLMSDHGFHPDRLRPSSIPNEPAGPAVEHRNYGIFVLNGPGMKVGDHIRGASVLDICPTMLSLFGLPVGQDMDGKPLLTVWRDAPKIESISSWDAVHGIDGAHPPGTLLSLDDSREALRQLEALGYVDPLPENSEQAADKSRRELDYNLACGYLDAQMPEAAAEIFARLWRNNPEEHRHGSQLFISQLSLGRIPQARKTFELLYINRRKFSKVAVKELKKRRAEFRGLKPEDLTLHQHKELDRLAGRAQLSPVPMKQMEAMLLLAEGKARKSLSVLKKLENATRTNPNFHIQIGQAYLALMQPEEAEKAFKKAIKLDSDNASANFGLAQTYLAMRRNYEAADSALTTVGLLYQNPPAHYLLGVALHRLGKINQAIEALRVCVTQNANFLMAHRRLAHIFEYRLKNLSKAAEHLEYFREGMARLRAQRIGPQIQRNNLDFKRSIEAVDSAKPPVSAKKMEFNASSLLPAHSDTSFITIVSGLPRSGTSLMMQILAAGGLPPLHDNRRRPDPDNPRGYFEFAPAMTIRTDHTWMHYGVGRALKLVAQLVPFLPLKFDYRIILMERSLDEILASQYIMLERLGRRGSSLDKKHLKAIYETDLLSIKKTLKSRDWPFLQVSYGDVIQNPQSASKQVVDFLGLAPMQDAMTAVVDASLYRQRVSSK